MVHTSFETKETRKKKRTGPANMFAETGLTANMFFKSDAMLISILSSGPCRLVMKGYVARRSMDKTYETSVHLNLVLEICFKRMILSISKTKICTKNDKSY